MLDPELELELVEEAYEPNAGGLGGVEGRGDDDKGDEDDYYDNYVEDGYQEEV